MAANWVRGFRRIGWVLIVVSMGLFTLFWYDSFYEFSGYDVAKIQKDYPTWASEFVVSILDAERTDRPFTLYEAVVFIFSDGDLKNRHNISFDGSPIDLQRSVALDPAQVLDKKTEANYKDLLSRGGAKDPHDVTKTNLADLRLKNKFPYSSEVETKRLNVRTFLVEMVIGLSLLIVFVQGSISVLAWIVRGFKSSAA